MHHFFVGSNQVNGTEIRITGTDVNHIRNVLRMKEGEEARISDGRSRDYRCVLKTITKEEILAEILEVEESNKELPSRIFLFQGLPKSDKMELIIQKTVELGVYQIIPVETRRCVVKLDKKKAETKKKRWNAIAESAAKQSNRSIIPEVKDVMSWKEALSYATNCNINFIPYELAQGMEETRALIDGLTLGMDIGVFIGPEGGFDISEVEEAVALGFHPITLGKRILRTETAGLTMLSILMYHLEQ